MRVCQKVAADASERSGNESPSDLGEVDGGRGTGGAACQADHTEHGLVTDLVAFFANSVQAGAWLLGRVLEEKIGVHRDELPFNFAMD